jgi:hypothetical protein
MFYVKIICFTGSGNSCNKRDPQSEIYADVQAAS